MKKLWFLLFFISSCMIMGCASSDESAMPERESWENNPGSISSFQQAPHSQKRIYLGDE